MDSLNFNSSADQPNFREYQSKKSQKSGQSTLQSANPATDIPGNKEMVEQLGNDIKSNAQTSLVNLAIDLQKTTSISAVRSPTGAVTRANLAFHMQQIVTDYYGQPFPHYDDIKVEYQGKEVLWKNLTSQEKYDVVYEHSLPHNRPKLLKLSDFNGNEQEWIEHIEERLFRGSHNLDGTPSIPAARMHDPRQSHGSDHGMRVAIFSAVYAYLYNKYDPDINITPEDLLAIQLAGAFHDSGRQTEGVDVDDKKSADNAAQNLTTLGFSHEYVEKCREAILGKDEQNLSKKHFIAKCVQCADSTEYGRFGSMKPKFLDIYKDFNGYQAQPQESWNETIVQKALKSGKTKEELNQEIETLIKEMMKITNVASTNSKRAQLSQPGKNYYAEILKLINPKDHPKIYNIMRELNVIGETESSKIPSVKSSQIQQAQVGTVPPTVVSTTLEETGELFPGMLSEIQVINASIGGSTGAKLVEDSQHRKFVQKVAGEDAKIQPDHLRAEYHTNKAYKALGVKVPEVTLYNKVTSEQVKEGAEAASGDQPIMLSRYVPGNTLELKEYLGFPNVRRNANLTEVQELVQKNFVADCLLANWDVIGLEFDNIRIDVDTKEIWRIDNGSGLDYRAQGEKKTAESFTSYIQEFEMLRDPGVNASAALLFSTIEDEEIIRQIDELLPKRKEFLATIPDHLKEIMAGRFDYLTAYRQALSSKKMAAGEVAEAVIQKVKSFIDASREDLMQIPIKDLETGLRTAFTGGVPITRPENKTTLFAAAQRLAQVYMQNNQFDRAANLRLQAALSIGYRVTIGNQSNKINPQHPKLTVLKEMTPEEKDAAIPEVRSFIDDACKDMRQISIEDLAVGLQKAFIIRDQISKPEDKTTLIIATERLAQFYMQNNQFDEALKLRLQAALSLGPDIPLSNLSNELMRENPILGLKLYPVDTSSFKNQTLSIQRQKFTDGAIRLHVSAKLSHPVRTQLQDSIAEIQDNPNRLLAALPEGFCTNIKVTSEDAAYQGKVDKDGKKWEGSFSQDIGMHGYKVGPEVHVIHFEGVGTVKIATDIPLYRTEYNRISIDLEPHISGEEAVAKLNVIFACLGLGSAASFPRPDDIERIKVMQLFRAFHPQEAYDFERDPTSFEESVESLKSRIGDKVIAMKEKLQTYLIDQPELMYQQEVYPGQKVWCVKGLAQDVRNAGGMGLMAGVTADNFDQAIERFISLLRSGSLSTQDRLELGIIAAGASSKEDLKRGGGESVFVRLVTSNLPKELGWEYPLVGKMQIFYDLDLIERVGYVYKHDLYGTKEPNDYKNRPSVTELTGADVAADNEVCIRNRVGPEFIKGVLVGDDAEKALLISALTAAGLITKNSLNQECANGIPIEKFIHVGKVMKAEYWA